MHNIVLFSGGMDSTTLLTSVIQAKGVENTTALTIIYGSVHNVMESAAAARIVEYFGVEHLQYNLPAEIFKYSGSALMGEMAIPDGDYRKDGPQDTVVPFRNGTMLSIAAALAARYGKTSIWIAAHADDGAGWAYPDCTPAFLGAMDTAIRVATMDEVNVRFPYVTRSKSDVVSIAGGLNAPLAMSYSCYKGAERHCGICATCVDRQDAFYDAGYHDPTEYTACMQYPNSALDKYPNLDKE